MVCFNYLGSYIWENLGYKIFDMIAFHSRKKRNFEIYFRNLKKQMPMSLGALNDEGINNVVNLSSEEFS